MSCNPYAEVLPLMRQAMALLDKEGAGASLAASRLALAVEVAEREQHKLPYRGNDNDDLWDGIPNS